MFEKILIANRGEIALRIQRHAAIWGSRPWSVHSEADAEAKYVKLADESRLASRPPPSAAKLSQHPAIISAAEVTTRRPIHPGYGFLAENADFAERWKERFCLYRPTAEPIRLMETRSTPAGHGEAAFPAFRAPGDGFPRHRKKRGRSRARSAIGHREIGRRGGAAACGSCTPSRPQERDQRHPREAEADVRQPHRYTWKSTSRTPGTSKCRCRGHPQNVIYLGERDCSDASAVTEDHGKKPAPEITAKVARASASAASSALPQDRYRSAGTFEYLYEEGEFFFIEMNTRIQVEQPRDRDDHRVDIVQEQIASLRREAVGPAEGHRAARPRDRMPHQREDPFSLRPRPERSRPTTLPGAGIRVDSHIYQGYTVPPNYDSLICKLIAYGADRGPGNSAHAHRAVGDGHRGNQTNILCTRNCCSTPVS